jgi:ABC-type protease/lipase transport system fused ATPase/permease subunit
LFLFLQKREISRYSARIQTLYELNLKQLLMQSIYYMVIATFLVNCVVQAGILGYGSHLVFQGQMDASALIAVSLLFVDMSLTTLFFTRHIFVCVAPSIVE